MDFLSVSNKDYIYSQIVLKVTLAQIKLGEAAVADRDGSSRDGRHVKCTDGSGWRKEWSDHLANPPV